MSAPQRNLSQEGGSQPVRELATDFVVSRAGKAYAVRTVLNFGKKRNAMKTIQALLAVFLLLGSTAPARADFKYTETTQLTGGTLLSMMKTTSIFVHGEAKKQEKALLDPQTTTHYLKGGRLRTDRPDGTAQIIDVENQRIIFMDMNKKTYAVATFDQIRAAMQALEQQLQQQPAQPTPQQKPQPQDVQLKINPTVHVTPGAGTRTILDQPTIENKVEVDLAMTGTATGADAPPPGQPNTATVTYAMNMDTYVAPDVAGYKEFAQFYRRMAEEVSWLRLPAMNVQIDPRVSMGMSELQKNSDAVKGFPLLSYVTMTMAATVNGQTQTLGANGSASNQQQPSNPPPSQSSAPPDNSPSGLVVKGLGGLFGKKKQQQDNSSNQAAAPPPNPNADPNAMMEMTTQVVSFSQSSLDGSLFDIPAGYMQVQEDPMQVFGGSGPSQQQPPSKR
jgi:hypothetical protein